MSVGKSSEETRDGQRTGAVLAREMVGGGCAYIDKGAEVSLPQIVHDTGFVEEGEICDIFYFVELGRIHLAELKGGYSAIGTILKSTDGVFALLLDEPGGDIADARVWNPDVLLGCELGGRSSVSSRLANASGWTRHGGG